MAFLDLKKQINKLLEAVSVDYIVEQGTSGIWTYRKWNSGIAECWGEVQKTTTFTVWTAPIYYGATYTGRYAYPDGLFISAPISQAILKSCGCDAWLSKDSSSGSAGDKTQTGSYYPLRVGSASGNVPYTVAFYAIGKWR